MNSRILLQKLIEIERSIGVETESIIRHKILDAQDFLLRMQGELAESLWNRAEEYRVQRFALLCAFSLLNPTQEES
jgi:hypothetical protein